MRSRQRIARECDFTMRANLGVHPYVSFLKSLGNFPEIRKAENAGNGALLRFDDEEDATAAGVVGPIRFAERLGAGLTGRLEIEVHMIILPP